MYQVLYRKWRPQLFADVTGQPQVTVTLKNELMAGRIAHAYLFTGSRGTGKTTCAKILAKAVNCLNPIDGDPCGECEICRSFEDGSMMDIVEIDAASNNGVDNIRQLREEANFTPAMAKYRVYIIDEVHMLSTGAFNALLKTLEEPPAHVIFILATTEVHKLPATILSRCQRFDFRRIPPHDIASRLDFVAKQEGAELEPQAALLIARLADGALRDALSLLDQCIGHDKMITTGVVTQTAGLVGREHLFELTDAIKNKDSSLALEIIDRLHNASKDMTRLCEELSAHFRNLMLIKTMKDAKPLIPVPEDEFEKLSKQALSTPLPAILHGLDSLQNTLDKMYRGGNRRVEMEMTMIRLCSPELDDSTEALVRRITALERGAVKPQVEADTQTKPEQTKESRTSANTNGRSLSNNTSSTTKDEEILPVEEKNVASDNKIQQQSAENYDTIEEMQANAQRLAQWPEILQVMRSYSQSIASAFTGSNAYVSGDYVLIDAPNSMAFELLRKSSQRDKMRDAIKQITGRVYKLGPYKKQTVEDQKDPLKELAEKARNAGIQVID